MKPIELISKLKSYYQTLPSGTILSNWTFEGVTNIAYGTPGGKWDPEIHPGYLFKEIDSSREYVIRPIGNDDGVAIAIESVHNTAQLINHNLLRGNNYIEKNNGNNLINESYRMTVATRVDNQTAKEYLEKNGLPVDGKVSEFNDLNFDPENVTLDLLKWSVIRENAKDEIRKNRINEEKGFILIDDTQNGGTPHYFPNNAILFGPPGTGKTYNTINKALEIIGGGIYGKSRDEIKQLYNSYLESGQIVFTTFHQSLSYEDFVEGIKPETPKNEGDPVIYNVVKGIFQIISEKAKLNYELSKIDSRSSSNNAPFELVYDKLKEDLFDLQLDIEDINNGKLKIALTGSYYFYIHAIDEYGSIKMTTSTGSKIHSMNKQTLNRIYDNQDKLDQIITGGMRTYYRGLINKLNEYSSNIKTDPIKTECEKFVLIIDEINRGNVSQIFGELITLIEEDKRIGADNELVVKLPYSQTDFCVPPNLYIIGTMNTADRSVEALDTALRRRFSFVEMQPEPDLLHPAKIFTQLLWKYKNVEWGKEPYNSIEENYFELVKPDENLKKDRYDIWENMKTRNKGVPHSDDWKLFQGYTFSGIRLDELLSIINKRIEVLLSRDHLIGHSYYINVYSEEDLINAFYDKIIPLLQEYFYGDYGKIGLVLGGGFVRKKKVDQSVFSDFDNPDKGMLAEKTIYEILDYRKESEFDLSEKQDGSEKVNFVRAVQQLLK